MGLWGKRDDMVVHETEPFNAEPPRASLARDPLTSVADFYVRNHGPVPDLDPGAWRLHVGGLVDHVLQLSLDELRERFTAREITATLQCAGNRRAGLIQVRDIPGEHPWGPGTTGTARWTGARLADVLAEAGLRPEAAHIAFDGPDVSGLADPPQAFGGSVPVAKALHGDVLLAWAMNGQPLPRVHGAPLRAVVPGWIGARSVKWLQRVTAREHPSRNYFQATAYRLLPADADPRKAGPGYGISLSSTGLNCDIARPDGHTVLPPGPVEVAGYALAGDDRQVTRVDVSIDGGARWIQADLEPSLSRWSWRRWQVTVDLPAGETVITARAWDCTAATQPESAAQLWNPKGYANNSWARLPVTCATRPGRGCLV
jgi:sulfite oxidase